MRRIGAFELSVLGLLASFAPAGEIGDDAGPIAIAEWVKGEPIDFAAGKGRKIYVVEFWATWCGPCRVSIPHLSELQEKYKDKDVIVLGVTSEAAGVVRPFVEKLGDKMKYSVAIDRDEKTSAAYMGTFGIRGIPHAFIVDKSGRIAWHGHPMMELDEALAKVVDGKLELGKSKRQVAADAYFEAAGAGGNEDELQRAAKDFFDAAGADAAALTAFSRRLLTLPGVNEKQKLTALEAARLAVKHTRGQDADANEALAGAFAATGKWERAVRYQERAVAATSDADLKKKRGEQLSSYRTKQQGG